MAYAQGVKRVGVKSGAAAGAAELGLLAAIRRRARATGRTGLTLGIGDDCALLGLRPGELAAVTTDLSLESRHFRLDWHSPESVGHRSLARGLSDLAAMGARPVAAFLSLAVPRRLTRRPGRAQKSWVERFYDGLLGLAGQAEVPLAGGDLAEAQMVVADIVLVGAVRRGQALLRSAARPGHRIFVTGELGAAARGFRLLGERGRMPRGAAGELERHLFPTPRLEQGLKLRRMATAAIDLSDGISTDLNHLCQESQVAAEIDSARLPVAPGATLAEALNGGEDYELLFTARPGTKVPRSIAGVPVTEIGRIKPAGPAGRGHSRVELKVGEAARRLEAGGWEHFV